MRRSLAISLLISLISRHAMCCWVGTAPPLYKSPEARSSVSKYFQTLPRNAWENGCRCQVGNNVKLSDLSSTLCHPRACRALSGPRENLPVWRRQAVRKCSAGRPTSLWRPLGYRGRNCGLQEPRTRQGYQVHQPGFLWSDGQQLCHGQCWGTGQHFAVSFY